MIDCIVKLIIKEQEEIFLPSRYLCVGPSAALKRLASDAKPYASIHSDNYSLSQAGSPPACLACAVPGTSTATTPRVMPASSVTFAIESAGDAVR